MSSGLAQLAVWTHLLLWWALFSCSAYWMTIVPIQDIGLYLNQNILNRQDK